jgi:glycosyltransferase involved in cell wall biosynthesis
VQKQRFSDWEYVLVDDGSTDETLRVIQDLASQDPRLSVRAQPNQGVHAARQSGFEQISDSAQYLVFLDADDELEPDFLGVMSRYLDEHPDAGMVYAACSTIDEDGRVIVPLAELPPRYVARGLRTVVIPEHQPETPLEALISRHEAVPSASMLRRETFERTHGWRRAGVIEDKDLVLQMALQQEVHFLPVRLTRYRRHATNRSSLKFYESMDDLHRRWWFDRSLSDVDRRRVRSAIAFDRRIAARTALELARQSVARHRWVPALTESLRATFRFAEFVLLSVRSAVSR